jgi:hypothetical protein
LRLLLDVVELLHVLVGRYEGFQVGRLVGWCVGCLVGLLDGRFIGLLVVGLVGFFVGGFVGLFVGCLVETHVSSLHPSFVQGSDELQLDVDEDQAEPRDLPDLSDLPLLFVVAEPLAQSPPQELLHQPLASLLDLDMTFLESLADLDLPLLLPLLPEWFEKEPEKSSS